MSRLTARTEKGLAYLVNVKPDEQEVDSPYKNTLQCILDCFERLAYYEDLEEQGRLAVLPCKVGDTVWFIKSAFSMAKFPIEANHVTIRGINCDGEILYAAILANNQIERRFLSINIGKTVFLSREEAEEALRKEKQ